MPFTRFTIPKIDPSETCNGRLRTEQGEGYCQVKTNRMRCPEHNGSNVKKAKEQQAKQAQEASKTLDESTRWWMDAPDLWDEKRKLLNLDRQLVALAYLIDELANRKPLAGLTLDDGERITKLIKTYAELVIERNEAVLRLWDALTEHGGNYTWMAEFAWFLMSEMTAFYDGDILEIIAARRKKAEMQTGVIAPTSTTALEVQTA